MSVNTDITGRLKRIRERSTRRLGEFTQEFDHEELATPCFKAAVMEQVEEEEWRRILERTRALLNKLKQ